MNIVLYNQKANNFKGLEVAQEIEKFIEKDQLNYVDVCQIGDINQFLAEHSSASKVILCGGDGTLNHFINDLDLKKVPANLYYFPCGSGNDFYNDVKTKDEKEIVELSKYFHHLPTAYINGKSYHFINGIGYGIDGYCCEEADRIRETSDKPINYSSIAVKGVLSKFNPTNATITIDGTKYHFTKVWLAPMMFGRYYGGGMKPCPDQDRLNSDHLSVLVWHGTGRISTLLNFSNIFKGTHVLKPKMCQVFTGKNITVEFDHPVAAQVDGETVLNVTKVEVKYNEN